MFIAIQKINSNILYKWEQYFPSKYVHTLRNHYHYISSLVWKYLISKEIDNKFGIKKFIPSVDNNGKPIYKKDVYWSLSHKDEYVFIGIDKKPLWLDIEVLKIRDEELKNLFIADYSQLWGCNWKNFYTLWTMKEAYIKKNLLSDLDIMTKIKLIKFIKKKQCINNIPFSYQGILELNWVKSQFLSWNNETLFYSICF